MARSGSPYSTPRDANRVPLLVAASTADGITPVVLEADPTTHLLQVSSSGGGAGGTQYTDGSSTITHPIGTIPVYDKAGTITAVSVANPLPVSATISTAGLATSANQTTELASLSSIDGKITAVNTGAVVVSSSALPSGASTAAKQPALGTAGTASTDVLTVQGITSMTALKVDGSGVTQPVSGTFWQATQPVSGTVTANAGTNLNTSALALDATLTGGTQIAIAKGAAASGASKSGNPVQTGGVFNTTQPTVTTGQVVEAQSTARGATIVAPGVDNFAVQATLAAETTKVIGAVNNLPATVDTNSGNKSASTLRVVLATDQPALTNKLLVTPDSVALPANQSVNVSQINGVTTTMGNGVSGTGVQRVTIASDSTGQITLAAGSALVGKVGIDQTTPGTTNAVVDTPVTSGGLSIYSASVAGTATSVKGSAGQLYGYHLFNTTAAVAYVQFFDLATGSVTLGSTAPKFSVGIPASGGVTINFDKGLAFATAITYACTTTRGGSTGATCDVNMFYK